jgi:aspartyl-tRNA(Asn)/glutamyl-tRNA(Gln) amidotransferase subunit A
MDLDSEQVVKLAAEFGIELSSEEATEYVERTRGVIDRMESYPPYYPDSVTPTAVTEGSDKYNAFRMECRLDTGDGPLSDLTFAVKDNLAVAGVPITCGSTTLEFSAPYHATSVARLLEAGATLAGTANMDEFALHSTGETCQHGKILNPQVQGCVSGGSSAGSGAAVAGELVDVALGSDDGGSIRIPASFCGVVGFKPTHRTVSRFGLVDLAPSLGHIGPLADSVRNACRALDVIRGSDVRDPSTYHAPRLDPIADAVDDSPSGHRVGLIEEALTLSDKEVARTVRETTDALADQGVDVEIVSFESYGDARFILPRISGTEFATLMRNAGHVYGTGTGYSEAWRSTVAEANDTGGYGENVRDRLVANRALVEATDNASYVTAQNQRQQFRDTVDGLLDEFDAIVTPTMPMTAPEFGEIAGREDIRRTITHTAPFNLSGNPALSVPCGEVDGAPVGLQVVTDWNDEATAACLGATVARAQE